MCKAEVCGACTGALMALGLKYGMYRDGDLDSKERANSYTVRFLDEFARLNGSAVFPGNMNFRNQNHGETQAVFFLFQKQLTVRYPGTI